jgi:hypothetical protein
MSINPQWLRAASQLALGEALSSEQCETLSKRLSVVEEVLPWLILKRGGFSQVSQFRERLSDAAHKLPSPMSSREHTRLPINTTMTAIAQLEQELGAIVRQNLAVKETAVIADSLISKIVQFSAEDGRHDAHLRATSFK